MSIDLLPPQTGVKTRADVPAGLIAPLIEPWIPEALDRDLRLYQPPQRHWNLLSPLRMLRFELFYAMAPETTFRDSFREVWQSWLQSGCVCESLPSRSALTQARARLPEWALRVLFNHTVAVAQQTRRGTQWADHRVLTVDGTPMVLSNSNANRTHFGATRHQHGEAYYPQAHAVWVSLLHSRTVIAEHLGSSHEGDERVAPALLAKTVQPGDLVLGDAHYGHYPTLATLTRQQAFYLVRVPGPLHIDEHITARPSPDDVDVRLELTPYIRTKYPNLQMPEHMNLRALHYAIPSRDILNGVEPAWFLTNLPRAAYSHAQLSSLPPLRWNHETLNNDIKTRLGLGELSSLGPDGVRSEVLAHLCISNIIRLILWQHRPDHPLLGSFTAARSAMTLANQQLRMAPDQSPHILSAMSRMILDQPLDLRPGRTEPRMIRPSKRIHTVFKTPRPQWHQQRKVG
jgi:hypothetical protein